MIVYTITFKRHNDHESARVLASDPIRAVEDFHRWAKKKYYSEPEILKVEKYCAIDIFYKTPKRKTK